MGDWPNMPAFVGCSLTRSADKVIGAGTGTPIDWNQEEYDTSDLHDNSTNNTRLIARRAGKWLVSGHIQRTGVGELNIYIVYNGASGGTRYGNVHVSGSAIGLGIPPTVMSMAISDYVEIYVFAGGGMTVDATGVAKARVQFTYMGV